MENPLWMLLPWAIFAVAVGIKFWRITSAFRRHRLSAPSKPEQVRQMLERIWEQ